MAAGSGLSAAFGVPPESRRARSSRTSCVVSHHDEREIGATRSERGEQRQEADRWPTFERPAAGGRPAIATRAGVRSRSGSIARPTLSDGSTLPRLTSPGGPTSTRPPGGSPSPTMRSSGWSAWARRGACRRRPRSRTASTTTCSPSSAGARWRASAGPTSRRCAPLSPWLRARWPLSTSISASSSPEQSTTD
jgi:hypothetical protein